MYIQVQKWLPSSNYKTAGGPFGLFISKESPTGWSSFAIHMEYEFKEICQLICSVGDPFQPQIRFSLAIGKEDTVLR